MLWEKYKHATGAAREASGDRAATIDGETEISGGHAPSIKDFLVRASWTSDYFCLELRVLPVCRRQHACRECSLCIGWSGRNQSQAEPP